MFKNSLYVQAVWNSLQLTLLTTVIATFLAYPIALAIHRCEKRYRPFLVVLVMIPFVASFLLRIYGWTIILRRGGILSSLFEWLGITDHPVQFLNSFGASLLGMVYIFLPFAILPIYAALDRIAPDVSEAAADLGANPWRAFWSVTFPMSLRGVIAAALMVFIPSLGDFATQEMMGDKSLIGVGQVIWLEFFTKRDWPMASTMAVVLTLILLGAINIVFFLAGRTSSRVKASRVRERRTY